MIIMIDNVWDDATDWCKWLEWWGIMRIDIILQMSVTDLVTKENPEMLSHLKMYMGKPIRVNMQEKCLIILN